MSDEVQKLAEDLVNATEEYKAVLSAIKELDSELFQQLSEVREKCENLESAVKGMMKKNPDSEVLISGHKFRVSTSTKSDLDLESAVIRAEELGHIEVLLAYGVLQFKGNASMLQRLPEEIQEEYKKFVSNKKSHRISMPKGLKRSW